MNNLVVSDNFTRGGLETHIFTLYEALTEKDSFTFAVGNFSSDLLPEGADIVTGFNFSWDCTAEQFAEDVRKLEDIIVSRKIDVINVHPFVGLFSAVIAGQLTDKPVVYTYHGTASFSFAPWTNSQILLWYFLSDALAKVFCVNETGRKALEENVHVKNAVFLPNCIDTGKYRKHTVKRNGAWAYISRLDPDGGKEALLKRLFGKLSEYGISRLDIYGDGAQREALERYVFDSGLGDRIRFMGFHSDICDRLDGKYNGIIGMGRVAMEGLAMGYPVLLAGYGRICGIVDDELFLRASRCNFVANEFSGKSDSQIARDVAAAYADPEAFDFRDRTEAQLSSAVIAEAYSAELQSAAAVSRANIISWFEALCALPGDSKVFQTDRAVFDTLCTYIEPYSLDPEVKLLFRLGHIENTEAEIRSENAGMNELAGKVCSLTSELREADGKNIRISAELENAEKELDSLRSRLEASEAALSAERSGREQAEAVNAALRNDLQTAENYMAGAESGINQSLALLYKYSASKAFKLVHFFNRLKWQFFRGSREDRKLFRQWFFSRWNRTRPVTDRSYNALWTVIEPLEAVKGLSRPAFDRAYLNAPAASETGIAEKDELAKHFAAEDAYFDEVLKEDISPEAQELISAIENRSYKGILIYPHIVFWEPLQTPQQLLKAFALQGWLCFFAESIYLDGIFREEEENLFICHEKDIIRALQETYAHATVLLTWMGSVPFVNRIPNKTVWYHILDHLEIFSYYCDTYLETHRKAVNDAAVVSYVAKPLADWTEGKPQSVYLPNGVNDSEIVNIHDGFIPDDMRSIIGSGHKVVGYYGYLAEWMDYEMVRKLAESRPDYEFVFIGKAIHDTSLIDKLPNVHLLGLKPFKELSDYAKLFDVATIPFIVDEKMDCVSPIKFYEYLALGLPVVSSKMTELVPFAEQYSFIYTADGYDEFLAALDTAMDDKVRESAREQGPGIAAANSWLARASQIIPSLTDDRSTGYSGPYNKPDILVLSIIGYGFRHQRPQHLSQRAAAAGHRVFYINAEYKAEFKQTEVENGLYVIDLPDNGTLSIHLSDSFDRQDAMNSLIDGILESNHIRDAMIIVDYPNWINAALHIRDKYGFPIITDYMDDFTGFLNPTVDTIRKNCIRLLKESALVAASSQFLYDIAAGLNKNTVLIRNGTQFDYFNSIAGSNAEPGKKKIIGYYGAIANWFAAELVCRCADEFPECDVVLVGEVSANEELLRSRRNIRLIGEVPYSELLPWLESFDVCLIPFDTSTDLIKATNPVKFYEYLAAGKKIVATEIPELAGYDGKYVYLQNDPEEFCRCVGLCLNGEDALASAEECAEFARSNDWDHRTESFLTAAAGLFPKISVIVLCYNKSEYTRRCLRSIVENTAYPNYEVIVVDNASTDDTAGFITAFAAEHPNFKAIVNDKNYGFAGGNNIGLKAAAGDYFVLLNNDTIVTCGWLTGLLKHYRDGKNVGLVGPLTNSIGNEARISISYSDISGMQDFAFSYTGKHMGEQWKDFNVLAMYCLMISRDVYNAAGPLDENYGIGMFEDDDYCVAAQKAGFSMVMAEDVFIHHSEGISFRQIQNDERLKMHEKNKEYFENKWNIKWKMHKLRPGVL